jgi:hypothetical protein
MLAGVKEAVRPGDAADARAAYDFRVRKWRRMTEEGADGVCDPRQMRALEHMLDTLLARDLEVTVVLYPRKPDTLTEKAKATTLAEYASAVRGIAEPRGIPVHDWSTSAPLGDDDFRADFDHVTEDGNRRLTEWMLAGDLHWLAAEDTGDGVLTSSSGNGRNRL